MIGTYSNLGDYYIIDVNRTIPVTLIQHAYITSDMCSFIPVDQSYKVDFYSNVSGFILQDFSNDSWFFISGGSTPGLNSYGNYPDFGQSKKYFFGKVSIDNTAQVVLSDCYEDEFLFTPIDTDSNIYYMNSANNGVKGGIDSSGENLGLNANSILIIFENGFINLKKTPSGIEVESVALSMPAVSYSYSCIHNNYVYHLEGTTITRLHLSSGSSVETLYTNSRILTSGSITQYLMAVGNELIFYQFAEDNMTVNTYSLSTSQPEHNLNFYHLYLGYTEYSRIRLLGRFESIEAYEASHTDTTVIGAGASTTAGTTATHNKINIVAAGGSGATSRAGAEY
jgi:hypothetical protein